MPKIRSRHAKPTRVAMQEVNENQVRWLLAEPVSPLEPEAE